VSSVDRRVVFGACRVISVDRVDLALEAAGITIVVSLRQTLECRRRSSPGRQSPCKHVGRRPRSRPVTEHPQWSKVLRALEAGHVNRAEAAKQLQLRKAVLVEALDAFPKWGVISPSAIEVAETG
jgi:hypothetical protein